MRFTVAEAYNDYWFKYAVLDRGEPICEALTEEDAMLLAAELNEWSQ